MNAAKAASRIRARTSVSSPVSWRSLDSDQAEACFAAGRVFLLLDAQDLAWDYLTSPVSQLPDERCWMYLAGELAGIESFALADRA